MARAVRAGPSLVDCLPKKNRACLSSMSLAAAANTASDQKLSKLVKLSGSDCSLRAATPTQRSEGAQRRHCCCSPDWSSHGNRIASRFEAFRRFTAEADSNESKSGGNNNTSQKDLPRVTIYKSDHKLGNSTIVSKKKRWSNSTLPASASSPTPSPTWSAFVPSSSPLSSGGWDRALKGDDTSLSESSKKLIGASEDLERRIWLAARNYRQSDHYDYSLFGLESYLDQAVGRHQRETMLYNQDRHLKDEQAKQVAPNLRQSPIAIMSMNPTYELQNKPLVIEYPATVENLKLQNTGFSWQIKIPYQISMTTNLYGAHLSSAHRYRLDQFHCHWGQNDRQGSEHTVDNRCYSAEMHFVHYNMEKYHTYSKAARHPDGLVVLSVFLDAQDRYHCHAELEKIVSHLRVVPLKGEHTIIRQAVRIENLLPANKSYWSYQGSLTTPPFFESVTWFILKRPIKCSTAQIQKFRSLKSALRHDEDGAYIRSNNRKTQPLNGRTIVNYDEHSQSTSSLTSLSSASSHAYH